MRLQSLVAPLVVLLAMGCGKGSERPPQLEEEAKPREIVVGDTARTIDSYLGQLEKDKGFSGGLLIIRNGQKIFSKGYGWADRERGKPFTTQTLASMGSITKSFTAAAILKLEEEGRLGVQDRLDKYFKDVPSDKAGITLHQLLTHSGGFQEIFQDDGGDYAKLETVAYLERVWKEPLAFAPGSKAVYTNVGMSVLGIIIEQVSGMEYEAYLRGHVLGPLGIQGIGYHRQSGLDSVAHGYEAGRDWGTIPQRFSEAGGGPYWNLKANGGLEASLDDMFIWCNALTDGKALKPENIARMFTPHVIEEGYDGQSHFGYGCNIAKSRRGTRVIDNGGSNGIYHARMLRYADEGLVFYMVTNDNAVNANMVMPNVTQLYFLGKIEQDGLTMSAPLGHPVAMQIYEWILQHPDGDLAAWIKQSGLALDNDMILFEVGERLRNENRPLEAKTLYEYYTVAFPEIVVAWNELGELYMAEEKKADARRCFETALKLRPGNPRATENLKKL